jgi:hypothetical protein
MNWRVSTLFEKWMEPLEALAWNIQGRRYDSDRLWCVQDASVHLILVAVADAVSGLWLTTPTYVCMQVCVAGAHGESSSRLDLRLLCVRRAPRGNPDTFRRSIGRSQQ